MLCESKNIIPVNNPGKLPLPILQGYYIFLTYYEMISNYVQVYLMDLNKGIIIGIKESL